MHNFFDHVKSWFSKVFTNAPAWNVAALSTLNRVAPEVEIVFSLVDPADAKEINPIINEVLADLGTASQLLKTGQTSGLVGMLNSVKGNLSGLLAAGHIKNADNQQRAQGVLDAVIAAVDSVIVQVPQS